jgi:hypothetical protein
MDDNTIQRKSNVYNENIVIIIGGLLICYSEKTIKLKK